MSRLFHHIQVSPTIGPSKPQSVNWGGRMLNTMLALTLALAMLPASMSPAATLRLQPALIELAAQHPDQVVSVIVQKSTADQTVEAAVTSLGGKITKYLRIINAIVVELPARNVPQLAQTAGVRWVSIDATMESAAYLEQTSSVCGVNLLTNGSFTNDLMVWENWDQVMSITTNAYSGGKALLIGPGQGGGGQMVSAEAGQTYQLSAWVKISGNPSWASIGIHFLDSAYNEIGTMAETEATSTTYTQISTTGTAPAGTRYILASMWKSDMVGQFFVDDLILQHPCSAGQVPPNLQYPCTGAGSIAQEYWWNAFGWYVENIPVDSTPSITGSLPFLESSVDVAEQYGQRLRGYVCPPTSGAYTFWLSADDAAELWLSTDANPVNKVRIAQATYGYTRHDWYASPEKQSVPIQLVAGQRYYIEVLHKEGEGDDYASVAWQGPSVPHQVIPGAALIPYTNTAPECSLNRLSNPGFELNLSGWYADPSAVIVTDKYAGTKALRIGPGAGGIGTDFIQAQPGETWALSGWGKIANNPNWAGMGIDFFDVNQTEIGELVVDFQNTTYTRSSITGVAPEGTNYLKLWVWKNGSTGTVTLDDLSIKECTKAPIQVVASTQAINTTLLKTFYNQTIRTNNTWNLTPRLQGQGVTVAVVDSGIDPGSDFTTADGTNRIIGQARFNSDTNRTVSDGFGHGNHVAGIIGGNGRSSAGQFVGVAPAVNLVNVKVSNDDGSSTLSSVIEGLQWVLDNRNVYSIRVVNLSLNSTMAESYHTSPLDAAVEILWFNKIVVVTSAGNNGTATLYPPANDPFVITVGATDDKGTAVRTDDTITAFSAFGTNSEGFAKPDLVAPGKNIVAFKGNAANKLAVTYPGNIINTYYFRMSGTSMAAPMVSGAVALLLQDEPNLNPDQVKYRLMATANKNWPGYTAAAAGAGYLDLYAAINNTTTTSANVGVSASQLLWTGPEPIQWSSVQWGSVQWGSVQWGSVQWGSVQWGSVQWGSDYWGP